MERARRDSPSVRGAAATILALASLATMAGGLSACAGSGARGDAVPPSAELTELAGLMTGTFSSADQAEADPQFFDVRMHVTPIWRDRKDGAWMYVEQAMATEPTHPYRQRVCFLHEPEPGVFVSTVYTLPEPEKWIGVWEKPKKFSKLSAEDLTERDGCAVTFRREDAGVYVGAIEGTGCGSDLPGVAYTISEVRITDAGYQSWDRGFDGTGAQVWGTTGAPYKLTRIAEE